MWFYSFLTSFFLIFEYISVYLLYCKTKKKTKQKCNKNNKQKRKSLHYVSLTFDVNVKWRSETFDEINVIIVQSVVVLNMNGEVFRIYDMNTLYKLGDLTYNGKYFI